MTREQSVDKAAVKCVPGSRGIPALNSDMFKKLGGVLALGVFVFNVLGM